MPFAVRPSASAQARLTRVVLLGTRGYRASLSGLLIAVFFAVFSSFGAPAVGAAESGFLVIVHPNVSEVTLERDFVADVFLKKKTRWENGSVTLPVDQRKASAVRRVFSDEILRRSVDAVRNYWQQRIFSGRDVPPPEVDSDAEVVRFVQSRAGAIGYVSREAQVTGVRVVTVR